MQHVRNNIPDYGDGGDDTYCSRLDRTKVNQDLHHCAEVNFPGIKLTAVNATFALPTTDCRVVSSTVVCSFTCAEHELIAGLFDVTVL